MNIITIFRKFPTQESCIRFLEEKRWGSTITCTYCGSANNYKAKDRLRHHCNDCRKSFSVTVGAIFHNTKMPLQKWFLAISLILNAKKGISTRQLARDLELPVKTAWSVGMRIRKAFKSEEGKLLKGIFEMDETYIRTDKDDDFKGGHSSKTHTSVVALKQRIFSNEENELVNRLI